MKKYKEIPKIDILKFLAKVCKNSSCWDWVGTVRPDGYGHFYIGGKIFLSHRVSYSYYNNLDSSMVIDHICKNRKCVNPDHLRVVTLAINTTENSESWSCKNKEKTHCNSGHEFTKENTHIDTDGGRRCRKCRVISIRNFRKRKRENV